MLSGLKDFLRRSGRWLNPFHRDTVTVRLEVPGLERKDLNIEVTPGTLRVSGERRVEHERRDGRWHVMERAYGRFERVIPLPSDVDGHSARAKLRHGVLTVTLHKRPSAGPRLLPVR